MQHSTRKICNLPQKTIVKCKQQNIQKPAESWVFSLESSRLAARKGQGGSAKQFTVKKECDRHRYCGEPSLKGINAFTATKQSSVGLSANNEAGVARNSPPVLHCQKLSLSFFTLLSRLFLSPFQPARGSRVVQPTPVLYSITPKTRPDAQIATAPVAFTLRVDCTRLASRLRLHSTTQRTRELWQSRSPEFFRIP